MHALKKGLPFTAAIFDETSVERLYLEIQAYTELYPNRTKSAESTDQVLCTPLSKI